MPAAGRVYLMGLIAARGLSVKAVAKRVGMDKSALYRFLSGDSDGTTHLEELCVILDAKMEDITDTEDEASRLLTTFAELRARDPGAARDVMDLARVLLVKARHRAEMTSQAEGTRQTDLEELAGRKKK